MAEKQVSGEVGKKGEFARRRHHRHPEVGMLNFMQLRRKRRICLGPLEGKENCIGLFVMVLWHWIPTVCCF